MMENGREMMEKMSLASRVGVRSGQKGDKTAAFCGFCNTIVGVRLFEKHPKNRRLFGALSEKNALS